MNNSFLQSKIWEQFRSSLGEKTFWVDGNLLIKLPLILGQFYLYSPRCSFANNDEFKKFLEKTKKIAKEEGVFFLRFEPKTLPKDINLNKPYIKKVNSRQPAQTLQIDLSLKIEEILASAKQKTRYNIKLAEKKGVEIYSSIDSKDINRFYDLAEITATRDNIKFHDRNYYANLIDTLGKTGQAKFYFARFNGRDVATAIAICYKDVFYYLHGASSDEDRNVMAPYLLQWQMIKDAKNNGFKWYDFWGVAPLKQIINDKSQTTNKFQILNEDDPWAGITRFKLGFAPTMVTGKYIAYPGCYEISYGKKRYLLYSMFKKVI